jgi:hypothetical protein
MDDSNTNSRHDVSCLYAPDMLGALNLFVEQLIELWKFVDVIDGAVSCEAALVSKGYESDPAWLQAKAYVNLEFVLRD